ncbi:hypothetical protein SLE2022_120260 [Rubroshorea leprosula]
MATSPTPSQIQNTKFIFISFLDLFCVSIPSLIPSNIETESFNFKDRQLEGAGRTLLPSHAAFLWSLCRIRSASSCPELSRNPLDLPPI